MKILITKLSTGIGYQILDGWHAYQQHLQHNNNYCFEAQYHVTDHYHVFDPQDYNISILFSTFDNTETITDQMIENYDLVLICNNGEPLATGHPATKKLLSDNPNVFYITNSLLTPDHVMYDKTIWFPHHAQLCRDFWTRRFYPQYFDNQNLSKIFRKNILYFINGANRVNRQFFIDLCRQQLAMQIQTSLGSLIIELGDSQWESQHDTNFRENLNKTYSTTFSESSDYCYYDNSVTVGIDQCFGSVPPGYFILPLYFENYCVVFPESGWQNNELNVTEKVLKCFFAGSLPFPVAGANVNKLYNQIGFYTAWNLLPTDLQSFDHELDHQVRYRGMVRCLEWFEKNSKIFYTDKFLEMADSNKKNFLACVCDYQSIKKFDDVMKKHARP